MLTCREIRGWQPQFREQRSIRTAANGRHLRLDVQLFERLYRIRECPWFPLQTIPKIAVLRFDFHFNSCSRMPSPQFFGNLMKLVGKFIQLGCFKIPKNDPHPRQGDTAFDLVRMQETRSPVCGFRGRIRRQAVNEFAQDPNGIYHDTVSD